MISSQQFLVIIKKRHNRYFTSKQAIHAYILEKYDVDYKDLKYHNENLNSLIKESRKTVYTLLKDMEKENIIEKYSKTTWRLV